MRTNFCICVWQFEWNKKIYKVTDIKLTIVGIHLVRSKLKSNWWDGFEKNIIYLRNFLVSNFWDWFKRKWHFIEEGGEWEEKKRSKGVRRKILEKYRKVWSRERVNEERGRAFCQTGCTYLKYSVAVKWTQYGKDACPYGLNFMMWIMWLCDSPHHQSSADKHKLNLRFHSLL